MLFTYMTYFLQQQHYLSHNTTNRLLAFDVGVYGELGRYPLYISRYVRIISYWCKVINTDNILMKKIYKQGLNDCNKGCKNWVSNIKTMLNNYGFTDVFENNHFVNPKVFPSIFKQKVIDNFIQEWFSSIENSTVLENYSLIKKQFDYENYLDILPGNLKLFYTRLRLSVHPLRVQTGRYDRNRIPKNERYCLCCNSGDIEDEFHFICICPCFVDLRKQYLKKHYYQRPSMFKFLELISSNNKTVLYKISKYTKEALEIRKTIINV